MGVCNPPLSGPILGEMGPYPRSSEFLAAIPSPLGSPVLRRQSRGVAGFNSAGCLSGKHNTGQTWQGGTYECRFHPRPHRIHRRMHLAYLETLLGRWPIRTKIVNQLPGRSKSCRETAKPQAVQQKAAKLATKKADRKSTAGHKKSKNNLPILPPMQDNMRH